MTLNLRGLAVAAILGVAAVSGGLVGLPSAAACDPCRATYKKVVTYKTVEEEVVTRVTYQKKVTRYDHCGTPYCAYETCYRDVAETVCRRVPVAAWVKVCE